MAFKSANLSRLVKFNSAASCKLIDTYEAFVDSKIAARNAEPKHQTFAPSSFRCPRISWFRLRGVQPDVVKTPDRTLEFTAQLGTACHNVIQENFSELLGDDWLDVKDYLDSIDFPYEYSVNKNGFEYQIEILDPPVRFAVDGIVRIDGEVYLLEIKTSEYSSFDELMNPKDQHIDQIKFYCTLLGLSKCLVLYQDRLYGGLKCYEVLVTDIEKDEVRAKIKHIQEMVEANIAPDRLPREDSWCTSSHCPYYAKCRQWG